MGIWFTILPIGKITIFPPEADQPLAEKIKYKILRMDNDKLVQKQDKIGSAKKKKEEIKELKRRIEDLENQLKRAVADYRNQEMRFDEEKKEIKKFANKDLLLRLVPAFDTLFLAEKHVADEGIRLTIKTLYSVLAEVGVDKIKTEGEVFNPQFMEAVTTDEGEENKVLEELRPGFTLNGKLIRPAQVRVGKTI